MPRNRVQPNVKTNKSDEDNKEFTSFNPKKMHRGSRTSGSNQIHLKTRFTYSAVVVGLVSFVSYYVYLGYLETRIHTPLAEEKVVQENDLRLSDRFWGTYRPGFYFGMKHRSPKSLITGLMWLLPSQVRPGNPGIRHQCQQGDGLKSYGWIEHDGVNFGVQEIKDLNMKLTTSFVKRKSGSSGGDWTVRIDVEPLSVSNKLDDMSDEIVLLFYVALEPGLAGTLIPERKGEYLSALHGNTSELGGFVIRFLNTDGVLEASHLVTNVNSLNELPQTVLENMITKRAKSDKKWVLAFNHQEAEHDTPNFFVHQVHVKKSFTMEVVYETENVFKKQAMLAGTEYLDALRYHRGEFNKKFEKTFSLAKKEFNHSSIQFAQAALSNLIGGVGHFYGTSKVQSIHNIAPVSYWPASLYTAVPSRSFFPRGFLWDEGFHLLLINKWNPEISVDIISHWLDLMNTEGWIPREQILGEEAFSRVPEEFIVQRNNVANPPTLIVALADLLHREQEWLIQNHKNTLLRMWPRLAAWYHWLNRTQSGDVATSYRWRGRNSTTLRELNPKTLASGLDDYPRASEPTDLERHLDLRCWIAITSKLMSDLADLLGYDSNKYYDTYQTLTDPELLDSLHWSKVLGSYADYGLHSNKVVLKYPPQEVNRQQQHRKQQHQVREKVRITINPAKYDFVNVFGYVSLFPLLLGILPAESENLLQILKQLDDPKLLWTPYGLRSLATNAPLYNTKNTEHDPPYWRGPIWININFLALKSLKHYSMGSGEVSDLAKKTHDELRKNVMENIIRQYYRTGYIWEQYSDITGDGSGCRPFTGWSALTVLIMAEEY